jgi:hypothetical protein
LRKQSCLETPNEKDAGTGRQTGTYPGVLRLLSTVAWRARPGELWASAQGWGTGSVESQWRVSGELVADSVES